MEHTRENLKKLSLVEIKLICKEYSLHRTGTKTKLINSILDFIKPVPVTVSLPTEYKPPKGKKVIGIMMGESDKRKQIGKLREKNKVKDLYYSMSVHYYEVDKDFNFIGID
jgi:hypothetical protein